MPRRLLIAFFACSLLLAAACSGNGGSSGAPTSATPNGTISVSGDHISATISVASGSAAVGATAGVQIAAALLTPPGLGAWTLSLKFDPAIVDIVQASDCDTGETFAACNTNAADDTLRLAGATATGLLDDVTLATITFTCKAAGTSDLTLTVDTLADATIGSPRDIDPTLRNGSITCR
jgi:hypothetical protein